MIMTGVDQHKAAHTATVLVEVSHQPVDSLRIAGHAERVSGAAALSEAVSSNGGGRSNVHGLGRQLTQWLIARGEQVLDVPSMATARLRELSRGGRARRCRRRRRERGRIAR